MRPPPARPATVSTSFIPERLHLLGASGTSCKVMFRQDRLPECELDGRGGRVFFAPTATHTFTAADMRSRLHQNGRTRTPAARLRCKRCPDSPPACLTSCNSATFSPAFMGMLLANSVHPRIFVMRDTPPRSRGAHLRKIARSRNRRTGAKPRRRQVSSSSFNSGETHGNPR